MLPEAETIYLILSAILGLCVGSFLNVVIYRLPLMLEHSWRREAHTILDLEQEEPGTSINLFTPPSTCPKCHQKIKPWHNIPVISYLLLRGRCGYCRIPISTRYPLIEALTAIAFAMVTWQYGWTPIAWSGMLLTAALITLCFIDLDTLLLPDQITLPLIWSGLIFNLILAFTPLNQSVLGAVIGYLSLWSIFWLFKLITGKEGMGYGDFKLLSALGAWLGPILLLPIIFLSSIIGIIISLVLRAKLQQKVPFGPAIAISGWIIFINHQSVINMVYWWLHHSGFN